MIMNIHRVHREKTMKVLVSVFQLFENFDCQHANLDSATHGDLPVFRQEK